jgi:PKD repeat protein
VQFNDTSEYEYFPWANQWYAGPLPISAYYWSFGDGNTSNLQNPVHQFNSAGNFLVVLKVVDNESDSSSITILITIQNPPSTPTDLTIPFIITGDLIGVGAFCSILFYLYRKKTITKLA